jgi:hypothetical protein
MENLRYEASPSHATPREAYEQNYAEIIQYLGRITAKEASNFRTEQPRAWEHIGRQEELIAMLQGVVDYLGA